jgi:glycosyltransferase involved in cell wall biosynthesis
MCARAAELLSAHYTWDAVAAATVEVYKELSSDD